MGATQSFIRNDEINGQGKEILLFGQRVKLNKRELDRIYHEFCQYEDTKTHLIDLPNFFTKCGRELPLMDTLLFQIYDENKTFKLNFLDFVMYMWNFLASSEDDMARMCYMLFDIGQRKVVDVTEVEYMVNVIWNFHPSKSAGKGVAKLKMNKDGTVTVEEFVLLCRHYPEILAPVFESRKILRSKIIFPRFWKELSVKRTTNFGSLTLLEINETLATDYAQISMEYLNLRIDDVPYQFIEQWKTTQRKKEHSYQGNVELPYELFEEKKQIKDDASDDLSTIF